MRIEIDQSGKIEDTSRLTVVAFSNGESQSVIILANEKRILHKHFRNLQKPRIFVYLTFAVLIFSLIQKRKNISQIVVDFEYPKQNSLIKSYLTQLIKYHKLSLDKRAISFSSIGKKSKAHKVANSAYKNKRANFKITAKEILEIIKKSGIN